MDEARDEHARYLMWTARSFDNLLERPLEMSTLTGPFRTLSALAAVHFDGLQKGFVTALARPKGTVSEWLTGKSSPGWRSLCEISYAFHVPLRDILEENLNAISMSVVRPLPLVVATRTVSRYSKRVDVSALKRFFLNVEANVFPEILTLVEVARRLEKTKKHLRDLVPAEYRSLSTVLRARRRNHIEKLAADRLARLFALVQTMPVGKEVGHPMPTKRAVAGFFKANGYSLRHAELQLMCTAVTHLQNAALEHLPGFRPSGPTQGGDSSYNVG